MFDKYEWVVKDGEGKADDLTLLSLSTCGFCASARQYLDERYLAYRYIDLDTISPEDKSAIKEEFRKKFGRRPSFPSLVLDDEKYLVGIIKKHWDEEVHPDAV